VTSPSTTHPNACLSMVSEKHTRQAKTTRQKRSVVGSTTGGIRAYDQSGSCLWALWPHIRDLVWTTLLIGSGVSAFTTGDMWVIPSILVLLCVSPTTFRRLFGAVIGG
jgi:hypothetical protein